ncbi:MAG TPA: putative zinc-binding protein [Candidatus Sulfotelmatobacter sp.]|nr:putative zinc-binding protein [Candidatus Sulfotelmatobacter sp.]
MHDLHPRKAGIVACSGEELAEGTVTRLAALKVLHELRPANTGTICLPLFLAGGEGDRAFARFHPTITVDGCELRCAARGTEMYSGKPAASIVVNELAAERGVGKIEGRRCLNEAGKQVVDVTAQRLAELVDQLVGKGETSGHATESAPLTNEAKVATCSCGSGVSVTSC